MKKSDLERLSLSKLNSALGHIKLGFDHLKRCLSPAQLQALLSLGQLDTDQKESMKSDKTEKSGKIGLILNTMTTGIFGAWLGFSGFAGLELGSRRILFILAGITFILGGLLGYFSFRATQTQAKSAIQTQQLNNLELILLKIVEEKLKKKISRITYQLKQQFTQLNQGDSTPDLLPNNHDITQWINALKKTLANKLSQLQSQAVYKISLDALVNLMTSLDKVLPKKIGPESPDILESSNNPFKRLADPQLRVPKKIYQQTHWLRRNFIDTLVGLIPTFLGTLGSMFVFLGGIPSVAGALGLKSTVETYNQGMIKYTALAVALSLTIFYSYGHFYAARKTHLRKQMIENTEKEISNQEAINLESVNYINTLTKLRAHLNSALSIFKTIETIDRQMAEKEERLNHYKNILKTTQEENLVLRQKLIESNA